MVTPPVRRLASAAFSLSLSAMVWADAGLNSRSWYPEVDTVSALGQTGTHVLLRRQFQLGASLDNSILPVVDTTDGRHNTLDAIRTEAFLTGGYGFGDTLEGSLILPLSLFSQTNDHNGYYDNLGNHPKSALIPGDVAVKLKYVPLPTWPSSFRWGVEWEVFFPTGNKALMSTDTTGRIQTRIPLSWEVEGGELTVTPGFAFWGEPDRLTHTEPGQKNYDVLLRRSFAFLMGISQKFALPWQMTGDVGLNMEWARFNPSPMDPAGRWEWAAGVLKAPSEDFQWFARAGTGLGRGVDVPALRVSGGLRWMWGRPDPVVAKNPLPEFGEADNADLIFKDGDLDKILEEAQREVLPPRFGSDLDSSLTLYVNGQKKDLGTIRFDSASTDLNAEARKSIYLLAEELKNIAPYEIKIEGHTDSVGGLAANQKLSEQRADVVRRELLKNGIPAKIVLTVGHAFKYPVATNGTKIGRARNRRIEISINGQSVRPLSYSAEDLERIRRWIFPGGKQPSTTTEIPDTGPNPTSPLPPSK